MIFGIGIDVLEAKRMHGVFERFGNHLVERLLMPQERASIPSVASRYASASAWVRVT
jgi:phosphopantetheinyl transferase (holo-ACP synthase)